MTCLLVAERQFESTIRPEGAWARRLVEGFEANVLHNRLEIAGLALWIVGALALVSWPILRGAYARGALLPRLIVGTICFVLLAEIASLTYKQLGYAAPTGMLVALHKFEELAELYFSIGILSAVLIGWRQQHRGR